MSTEDPVLLLRMCERDWVGVVTDLNTDTSRATCYGDVDTFTRLLDTCRVNLEILRRLDIPEDVTPRCLAPDSKGKYDYKVNKYYLCH